MTRLGKLKKYEDISPGILSQYKEPDRVVIVNNDDPDMKEIRIPLPECFDWRKIDGYGLPAKEQKWKTPVYPLKLVRLEEESENIDDLLETIELNQDYYKEEIKWIRLQWERRLKGYWLFINGKPTYLDGWHYFYCGFWNLDIGLPEYRDRDRRFFHFARYCYTTTTDNEDNDFGFRTCLGFNYPKHRRDGATHKSLCIGYEIVSRIHRANGGIQSLDDDNAQEHYTEKLIPAWQDMPFFFKPAWDGSTNPKEQLVFKSPPMRSRGGKNVIIKKRQLGGKFNYASTAKKKFYDGKKLHYIDLEEEGKTKPSQENILERWDVIRECLGQGSGSSIHGFSIHPTTVGEMREEGGENYYALCESSHWNDRNPKTGLTDSGLFNLFIPAFDGLENFVGKFGESIIESPTKEQAEFIGRDVGAKEYIMSARQKLLDKNTSESLRKYRTLVELFPTTYAECFRIVGGDTGFNHAILDASIERLRRDKDDPEKSTVFGNLKWIITGIGEPVSSKQFIERGLGRKIFDGRVEFFPDEDGRWSFSRILSTGESNRKIMNDGSWFPEYPGRFTASADTFKFLDYAKAKLSTDRDRMSNGGGSVFWERDKLIDPDDKEIKDWVSNRFVGTYNTRTDDRDEYAEDMLMACIYFGAMMYPEMNLEYIQEYFIKRGYRGFLKYDIDPVTNKIKEKPGFYSGADKKQDLFNVVRDYIQWHGHRERHIEFLMECKKIKGIEFMTKFDLFTACGGALLGSRSSYPELLMGIGDEVSIDDFIEEFVY